MSDALAGSLPELESNFDTLDENLSAVNNFNVRLTS